MRLLRVWNIIPLFMHKISIRVVCVNGERPLFYPVLQLWGFCVFKVLHPFLCTRFPPGWLVSMVSAPCSTPHFSYDAFAGLKHYTPFYAQDFHPGGLCQWWALPVLPRTSVMMLLRVWSIILLFMRKISTRVVCVNGKQPCLLHSFCLDGSRTSSPSEWSSAAVRWV